MWEIPKWWSLRDAATVPVAFLTAYYALVMRGGLEAGHRVLVHSGTGAVGLAAIRICLHRGCDVSFRTLMYLQHSGPALLWHNILGFRKGQMDCALGLRCIMD